MMHMAINTWARHHMGISMANALCCIWQIGNFNAKTTYWAEVDSIVRAKVHTSSYANKIIFWSDIKKTFRARHNNNKRRQWRA